VVDDELLDGAVELLVGLRTLDQVGGGQVRLDDALADQARDLPRLVDRLRGAAVLEREDGADADDDQSRQAGGRELRDRGRDGGRPCGVVQGRRAVRGSGKAKLWQR
jgi:hypothetical protein